MSHPAAPPQPRSVSRHLPPLAALLIVVASGAATASLLRPRGTDAGAGERHHGTPAQLAALVEQRSRTAEREGDPPPLLVLEVERPRPSRPNPARASAAPAAPDTHTVRAGEGLGVIAAEYGTTVSALVAANDIQNPNLVSAGQRLAIPRSAAPRARPAGTPAAAPDSAAAVAYATRALAPLAAAVNRAPAVLPVQLRMDSATADSIRPLLPDGGWTRPTAPGGEMVWRRAQRAPGGGRDFSGAIPFAVQLGVGIVLLGLWRVAGRRALAPAAALSTPPRAEAEAAGPAFPGGPGASPGTTGPAARDGQQDGERTGGEGSGGADRSDDPENSADPGGGEKEPGLPDKPEKPSVHEGSADGEDGGIEEKDVPEGAAAGEVIEAVHPPAVPGAPIPPAMDGRGRLATVRTPLEPDGYVLVDGCLLRAWLEEGTGEGPWIGEQVYVRPGAGDRLVAAPATAAAAGERISWNGEYEHEH